jgi:glucan 1,3-beta-glucosidase
MYKWARNNGRNGVARTSPILYTVNTRSILTHLLAEHYILYQYNLANAKDHWIGFTQMEMVSVLQIIIYISWINGLQPYYQPSPAAPLPFSINGIYSDPSFPSDIPMACAVNITN